MPVTQIQINNIQREMIAKYNQAVEHAEQVRNAAVHAIVGGILPAGVVQSVDIGKGIITVITPDIPNSENLVDKEEKVVGSIAPPIPETPANT